MATKFDKTTATKAECITESERLFNVALRAEASGKSEKLMETGLNKACEVENLAFDGRS